jgi:hypothetical protein
VALLELILDNTFMCVVEPKYRTLPDAISKRIEEGISFVTTELAGSSKSPFSSSGH